MKGPSKSRPIKSKSGTNHTSPWTAILREGTDLTNLVHAALSMNGFIGTDRLCVCRICGRRALHGLRPPYLGYSLLHMIGFFERENFHLVIFPPRLNIIISPRTFLSCMTNYSSSLSSLNRQGFSCALQACGSQTYKTKQRWKNTQIHKNKETDTHIDIYRNG